jgi:hypothetical protein
MRISLNKAAQRALTSAELITVLAVISIIAVLVFAMMVRSQRVRLRATCIDNQKQIVLSFKMFAGDSAQIYPVEYFTDNAHRFPSNSNRAVWEYLCLVSNELGSAKVLVCPKDISRRSNSVAGFSQNIDGLAHPLRQNSSISYFLGMSAHETKPNSLALGDRNLALNSASPLYNSLGGDATVIATNSAWRRFPNEPFHGDSGYYALSDGSVQQASNARLQEALRYARDYYGTNANRFLFPQ